MKKVFNLFCIILIIILFCVVWNTFCYVASDTCCLWELCDVIHLLLVLQRVCREESIPACRHASEKSAAEDDSDTNDGGVGQEARGSVTEQCVGFFDKTQLVAYCF